MARPKKKSDWKGRTKQKENVIPLVRSFIETSMSVRIITKKGIAWPKYDVFHTTRFYPVVKRRLGKRKQGPRVCECSVDTTYSFF